MASSASDPSSSESRSSSTTISATPPTFYEAAYAVLNTNELLCEIIGHLPLGDIVTTTGVCKTWRHALKTSLAIQQALFLAPTDVRRIKTVTEVSLFTRIEDIPHGVPAVVGEVNPFLARIGGPVLSSGPIAMSPRERFDHPLGLWRDMHITQPPTTQARVCLYSNAQKVGDPKSMRSVMTLPLCDEGIRMGQLYDFIEEKVKARPEEQVPVRIVLPDFQQAHSPYPFFQRRWEVRNGEVVGRILPPPGRELSKDKSEDGVDSE
jgi:hypothetical protein